MDILTETFQVLKDKNLVKTETEFSLHWLHKSERYYSMIKHSEREASVGALCTLLARLRDAGERVEVGEQGHSDGPWAARAAAGNRTPPKGAGRGRR